MPHFQLHHGDLHATALLKIDRLTELTRLVSSAFVSVDKILICILQFNALYLLMNILKTKMASLFVINNAFFL